MRDPREISRSDAAAMGAEAKAIGESGRYVAPSGALIELGWRVERAREDTTSHPPGDSLPMPPIGAHRTRITVREESTLSAAKRLRDADLDPVALNFASARHPGGGFLSGARAQEESLCRSSALYACIAGQEMYAHHSAARDTMYSSWMLYSPSVPVFRGDDGALLEAVWSCAFITAPAPNVKELRKSAPERLAQLPRVMDERIERILALAAMRGHRSVVLGAWGCGAFGGDSEMVASRFASALYGAFEGVFEEVVFAVLDTSPERKTIGPFERRFREG